MGEGMATVRGVTATTRSFDEWWVARRPALLRFAYAVAAGDAHRAEDVLQVVMVRVWRRWAHIIDDGADAYVRKAIVNEHLAFRRLSRNRFELPHAVVPERLSSDEADGFDAIDVVWRALAVLPRRQQAVLALRYCEDLSDAQIAVLLGIGESAVRSHAARGLASLRLRVDAQGRPNVVVREES